jgi:hypothetical protein
MKAPIASGGHAMRTPALLLAAAAALAGCGESSFKRASPQPPASTTGFLAVVAAGGRHKLYLPAQSSPTSSHAMLAVVDAAAPHGASGLLRFIDLGVDGAPQAVGASGLDVVVVDAATPTVYFVNAASDTRRGLATLPVGSQSIPFSDNASYSMGAAVDAGRRKAWISVSYGLLEYDLDSHALSDVLVVPVPENFAFDPGTGRIYAPFYLCDPPASAAAEACVPYLHPDGPAWTDGLTIIDLDASPRAAYTLVDPLAADPQSPLGRQPDAVAVDFALGVAVVAIEDPSSLQVLDLGATTSDAASLTCEVPAMLAAVPLPGPSFTQVAADEATHLVVVAQEYGAGVVFLDLAQAAQGTVDLLDTVMPALPGGAPWVTRADPHGAAIGVVDGRSYAFLVSNDRDWIARIDLQGVAGVMAGAGTFAAQVAYVSVPAPP